VHDAKCRAEVELGKSVLGENDVGTEFMKRGYERVLGFDALRRHLHPCLTELIQYELGVRGALID
jgi:hypothetical protein